VIAVACSAEFRTNAFSVSATSNRNTRKQQRNSSTKAKNNKNIVKKQASLHNKSSTNKRQPTNNPQSKQSSLPQSIGEQVQQAQTVEELLQVAAHFWLPTDADLKPHLRTQHIHHEKRQRWSAQLLAKLGDTLVLFPGKEEQRDPYQFLWHEDDRFARAVLAVAMPFETNGADDNTDDDDEEEDGQSTVRAGNEKERRAVREAILGLHSLAGASHSYYSLRSESQDSMVHKDVLTGVQLLITRCEAMANDITLQEAVEIRWAARGLLSILGPDVEPSNHKNDSNNDGKKLRDDLNHRDYLIIALPNLESRVERLPFDILQTGIDLTNLDGIKDDQDVLEYQKDIMTSLQKSIPFQFDTIVTRRGSNVQERRGTAWVAENGIGALAYSGKLMPPLPLPPLVRSIMRRVETAIGAPMEPFFDCALCNFYPDGDSACKFHTDPEHGSIWERLTCVVAVGSARRFAFRPIETSWEDWDTNKSAATGQSPLAEQNNKECARNPAVIRLFPGDVVQMHSTCNDDFHHAVYPEHVKSDSHVAKRTANPLSILNTNLW
jgi:alkylated DNA repair dioxygenase AlkB